MYQMTLQEFKILQLKKESFKGTLSIYPDLFWEAILSNIYPDLRAAVTSLCYQPECISTSVRDLPFSKSNFKTATQKHNCQPKCSYLASSVSQALFFCPLLHSLVFLNKLNPILQPFLQFFYAVALLTKAAASQCFNPWSKSTWVPLLCKWSLS